jgi:hypothetical protein
MAWTNMRQTAEGDPGKFRNTILMAIMQFKNGNLLFFEGHGNRSIVWAQVSTI